MYHSWAALFKVLCRVHDLTNHIIPPTDATELGAYENLKSADLVYWKRLDAAVLNWIYGSISPDLLTAILLKDDTAQSAWARLESMFQDNKASSASHLEQDLTLISTISHLLTVIAITSNPSLIVLRMLMLRFPIPVLFLN